MADTTIYPYGTNGQLPSSIGIINDTTTGGADKALSAEEGRVLRKSVSRLLDSLAPTSFTGTKPTKDALGIAVAEYTITLPSDTRIDMTNGATSIEIGESYSNTLSVNETAEEGYVLRGLSATMAGGGTITVDSTTGTVSTTNVTGNITVSASVGEPPALVHSYAKPATTDANDKNMLEDIEGNFDLYLQADAGYATTAYPSGWYANGKNDGYRIGYGNRDLSINEGDDFTIVWKGVSVIPTSSGNSNGYNSSQASIKFYDADAPNNVRNGQTSKGVGQFRIRLSTKNDYTSGFGTTFWPHISYMSSSVTNIIFSDSGATGNMVVNKTYNIVMSYNGSSKTATAWVIEVGTSSNTLKYSGALNIPDGLILPCIAMASGSGLDVYNYAMTESDITAEYIL